MVGTLEDYRNRIKFLKNLGFNYADSRISGFYK